MSRLRAVILTPYYYPVVGGVETHARQQARCLAREGVHTWVLTKQMGPETPASEVLDGVPVVRVPPQGPRHVWAKWRMVPAATRALLRRRAEYDVIICPDYRGVGLAALAAGRTLGRPVVYQAATPGALSAGTWDPALRRIGFDPQGLPGRLLTWPVRTLYGRADAYACISREIEREVRATVRARAIVSYLPHALDLDAFRPVDPAARRAARDRLGLSPGARVAAFVGRLGREKGVLDLLDAWRRLEAAGTLSRANAVLLLVGPDMPDHPLDAGSDARALAATLPPRRVVFAGPTDDVRPFLAASDVFVQPSHYEAFGISVIEAMATCLPVVATAVGGMREYLSEGQNALLVPPHDPAALGAALGRALGDEVLGRRLGAEARATVECQFDQRVVTRRWLELLERLVD